MRLQRVARLIAAVGLLSVSLSGAARAEADTVRIAKQFGLGYLPLTMMEEQKLFEQQAKKQNPKGTLVEADTWQASHLTGPSRRELEFWVP